MRHAEALLFVDHHQPEVGENDVALDQAVGADQDVELALRQQFQDPVLLGRRAEAGEHLHPHRERRQALGEGLKVLLGQDGGGHQHRHLHPVHHGLERGAQRDFRLPVPDVAADQAVHRPRPLHILLDFVDGAQLIVGLHIGEGSFQFPLPRGIGGKGPPLRGFPLGVQRQHVAGDVQRGAPGAFAGRRPFLRSEARERRRMVVGPDVARQPVGLMDRDIHLPAVAELHLKVLAVQSVDRAPHQAGEQPDPEFDVDDEIPGFQVGVGALRRERFRRRTAARFGPDPAEDFIIGQQVESAEGEPLLQRSVDEQHVGYRRRRDGRIGRHENRAAAGPLFVPDFEQPVRLARDHHHAVFFLAQMMSLLDERFQNSAEMRRGSEGCAHRNRDAFLLPGTQMKRGEVFERFADMVPGQMRARGIRRQGAAFLGLAPQKQRMLFEVGDRIAEFVPFLQRDDAVRREVIQQTGRRVGRRDPVLEREIRPQFALGGKLPDPRQILRQEFARRRDREGYGFGGGALGGRIEHAQGLDLIAEEFDPNGKRGGRRPDIDDPAAPAELAGFDHQAFRAVPEVYPIADQRFRRGGENPAETSAWRTGRIAAEGWG